MIRMKIVLFQMFIKRQKPSDVDPVLNGDIESDDVVV